MSLAQNQLVRNADGKVYAKASSGTGSIDLSSTDFSIPASGRGKLEGSMGEDSETTGYVHFGTTAAQFDSFDEDTWGDLSRKPATIKRSARIRQSPGRLDSAGTNEYYERGDSCQLTTASAIC